MAGYKHLEIPLDFQKYVKDKKESARAYYRYLLSRVLRMFQYKNLPDTIPHEILDRYLFMNGIALITKVNDSLYCFYGNLGGPQDVYYRPTEFIVANPHLKVNGELFSANIPVFPTDSDASVGQPTGVLIRNDTEWVGLHPLIARYSYLMAENTLTLRTADVMLRVIALITAKTDKEFASANEYLKSLEKGELGVVGESAFHEGIELQSPPSQNGSYLTQFIEYQQYLKGSFFGDIGLSANYNMKREAIGKGESTLDQDALLPLAENMLKCRQEDLQKVNDMFGTNISVEFSSSWLTNKIETLATLSTMISPTPSPTPFGQPSGVGDSGNGEPENEAGDSADFDSEKQQDNTPENRTEEVTGDESEKEPDNEVMEPPKEENPESHINDISVDEEFTELLEEVEEVGEVGEDEDSGLTNPERSEDGNSDDEESSADKASSSNS